MLRRIIGWTAAVSLAFASSGMTQDKTPNRLQELLAAFPTPAKKDGKLADVDKAATDAAVAEFLKDLDGSIAGLADLLSTKGEDIQVRHALHAIVMRVGGDKNPAPRQAAARAFAGALDRDRPNEIRGFLIRQLQLIGDEKQTPVLGKLLLIPELTETAAQALLAIKADAGVQFRVALPKATGKQRLLIVHALGALKDKASADPLRQLLGEDDRDLRLTAAWALANLPDAAAADRLLKLADGAKGFERHNATDSCLLLAGNLLASGDRAGARHIYSRLHEARAEPAERYVKDAAAKGLEAAK
jgi:HEAT repeat protein